MAEPSQVNSDMVEEYKRLLDAKKYEEAFRYLMRQKNPREFLEIQVGEVPLTDRLNMLKFTGNSVVARAKDELARAQEVHDSVEGMLSEIEEAEFGR